MVLKSKGLGSNVILLSLSSSPKTKIVTIISHEEIRAELKVNEFFIPPRKKQ